MKNLTIILILQALFLCSSCENKAKQHVKPEIITEEKYAIPFILKNGTIFIEGVFKDSTCYFILDNGAMVTCLSQALFQHSDTIGLRIPDILPYPKYAIPIQIKLKDYDFLLQEIAIANVAAFTSKIERFAAGIIGVELFANEIIEFNFEESLMIIRNNLPEDITKYQSLDLLNLKNCTYWFDSLYKQIEISGFYDSSGNSYKNRFTLDTGTPGVVFNKTIVKSVDFELSKKDTTTLAAFILNNRLNSNIDNEDWFEQRYGDGILGVPFFFNFHVIFDYPNNKLYLKKRQLE